MSFPIGFSGVKLTRGIERKGRGERREEEREEGIKTQLVRNGRDK